MVEKERSARKTAFSVHLGFGLKLQLWAELTACSCQKGEVLLSALPCLSLTFLSHQSANPADSAGIPLTRREAGLTPAKKKGKKSFFLWEGEATAFYPFFYFWVLLVSQMIFLSRQRSAKAGWVEDSWEDGDEQSRWIPGKLGFPPLLWCRTINSSLAV